MASYEDVGGGNIFKQAWVTITSFFGSFLSGAEEDVPDETTGLTKQQKTLIRKSWTLVMDDKLNIGVDLFIRLFTAYPSSQQLFDKLKDITDMEELAKNKKMKAHALRVMAALNYLVENIENPDILDELLRNTAITHYRIRMEAHYFEDLGKVLLECLAANLGDKFTPKTKDAWAVAYGFMTSVMLDEMEQLEPSHDSEK